MSGAAVENSLPFAIAADEDRRVHIPEQPAGEIVAGDLHECGLLAEPGGEGPSDFSTYFVVHLVLHGQETSRRFDRGKG